MKQKLLHAFGLVVFVMVLFAASSEAQHGPPLPSWDQKLPAATRFVVLSDWGGAAVLDKETGLVWEKSPSVFDLQWISALGHCDTLTVGNRMGWRLPTVVELTSLVDPSVSATPMLPNGHPFQNVQPVYWSANTTPELPTAARAVVFIPGGPLVSNGDKTGNSWVWCVRGGSGPDDQ